MGKRRNVSSTCCHSTSDESLLVEPKRLKTVEVNYVRPGPRCLFRSLKKRPKSVNWIEEATHRKDRYSFSSKYQAGQSRALMVIRHAILCCRYDFALQILWPFLLNDNMQFSHQLVENILIRLVEQLDLDPISILAVYSKSPKTNKAQFLNLYYCLATFLMESDDEHKLLLLYGHPGIGECVQYCMLHCEDEDVAFNVYCLRFSALVKPNNNETNATVHIFLDDSSLPELFDKIMAHPKRPRIVDSYVLAYVHYLHRSGNVPEIGRVLRRYVAAAPDHSNAWLYMYTYANNFEPGRCADESLEKFVKLRSDHELTLTYINKLMELGNVVEAFRHAFDLVDHELHLSSRKVAWKQLYTVLKDGLLNRQDSECSDLLEAMLSSWRERKFYWSKCHLGTPDRLISQYSKCVISLKCFVSVVWKGEKNRYAEMYADNMEPKHKACATLIRMKLLAFKKGH